MKCGKYSPKDTNDLIINKNSIFELKKFIFDFKKQKKKALLIYGPPGTGKTASVYAISNEHDLEVVELNASQSRSADEIETILKQACFSKSLLNKEKIVLIDDVDCYCRKDRGIIASIVNIIKKTKVPIILTSKDSWSVKLGNLRNYCNLLKFDKIGVVQITKFLEEICLLEKIKYELAALNQIAKNADGDIRAALNDLEIMMYGDEIKLSDLAALGKREKEKEIFKALDLIFKDRNLGSISAFDNMDLNFCMRWVAENIINAYKNPEEIARAYECLSRADLFRARIRRQQWWRFKYYQNIMMTAGISLSKKKKRLGFVRWNYPRRSPNKRNMPIKNSIAQKIGDYCHVSRYKAIQNYLPLLKIMYKHNKNLDLEFNPEEIDYLKL